MSNPPNQGPPPGEQPGWGHGQQPGNLAEVVYRLDGEDVTTSYPLVKEAGDWRIDCFYDC